MLFVECEKNPATIDEVDIAGKDSGLIHCGLTAWPSLRGSYSGAGEEAVLRIMSFAIVQVGD